MSHPVAMMAGMRTTTSPEAGPDFVTASFASCASFASPADGSPVCDACGWLVAEHEPAGAEVRALPRAVRVQSGPKRLAS